MDSSSSSYTQNGTPASAHEVQKGHCLTGLVDIGSVMSHRYYLARHTVMEMLKDRGYDIPHLELTRYVADFRSEFGDKPDLERLRVFVPLSSNPFKKIMVIFWSGDEIRTAAIRHLYGQIMRKENLERLILVADAKMNHLARKELEKYPVKSEFFQVKDLLVNITKHILQPKHEILITEEKSRLLMKYRVEEKQLPHLMESDAIARYYGLEKGQVLKVALNHDLYGSLVTYRCVV